MAQEKKPRNKKLNEFLLGKVEVFDLEKKLNTSYNIKRKLSKRYKNIR